ncbi:MAG: sodium:alanine symporter family protein [Fibrobacter sp.]|nr:sodium:alanine symporter family protein [Fibrobacter sp.]
MSINAILDSIDGIVWGIPTIVLILATGLILTIRARGIQFTKFGRAFKSIFKENEGKGELSGFAALCTALSATIGTGNIVGVLEHLGSARRDSALGELYHVFYVLNRPLS